MFISFKPITGTFDDNVIIGAKDVNVAGMVC